MANNKTSIKRKRNEFQSGPVRSVPGFNEGQMLGVYLRLNMGYFGERNYINEASSLLLDLSGPYAEILKGGF